MSTADLNAFVKAYDVRGLVGSQLTAEVVEALAAGFVDELGAAGREVVVGHDMRDSSPEFAAAFARGASARGALVTDIGLCSTDETYFASGHLDAPAAMFTASHNPATYNGIKFSRAGAQGISLATGLAAIRDRAQAYLDAGTVAPVDVAGTVTSRDVLPEYAAHLRSLVERDALGAGARELDAVVGGRVVARREHGGGRVQRARCEVRLVGGAEADGDDVGAAAGGPACERGGEPGRRVAHVVADDDAPAGCADLVGEACAERLDGLGREPFAHDPADVVRLHDRVEARANLRAFSGSHALKPTSPIHACRTICQPTGAEVRSA